MGDVRLLSREELAGLRTHARLDAVSLSSDADTATLCFYRGLRRYENYKVCFMRRNGEWELTLISRHGNIVDVVRMFLDASTAVTIVTFDRAVPWFDIPIVRMGLMERGDALVASDLYARIVAFDACHLVPAQVLHDCIYPYIVD